MSNHEGRPTVLESLGLNIQDIVTMYDRRGSVPKTAAALGISCGSVKKYLHQARAMRTQGGQIQPFPWIRRRETKIFVWFQDHRDQILPRSSTLIAELSGFTIPQVKKFLNTRRKAAKAYLESLGDLRDLPGSFIDSSGRRIPYGMLGQYQLEVDIYDLSVKIHGSLNWGGSVVWRVAFENYTRLLRK